MKGSIREEAIILINKYAPNMGVCVLSRSVVSDSLWLLCPWILQARFPCSPPGDLPNSGIKPESLMSPNIGRQILYH